MRLRIVHLYPDLMNLYGDRGNILTLVKRAQWRDIETEVIDITIGDQIDFSEVDIIFMGGGQDRGQKLIADDLSLRKEGLKKAVESGLCGLLVCGGYQMFGRYFRTERGEEIPGIDIIDAYTVAGPNRLVGNILIKNEFLGNVVGFENHSGKTLLGPKARPLGKVVKGNGNNGEDGTEGAIYNNLFGTYLHGPILPKNPNLADYILELALHKRDKDLVLKPLDDELETRAYEQTVKRIR